MKKKAFQIIGGSIKVIDIEQILYLRADESVTRIIVQPYPPITAVKNLGFYQTEMEENYDFILVYRGLLVNSYHITMFHPKQKIIELSNGEKIPVSRRYFGEVKTTLDRLF